ncbi:MAG: sulfatase, partial [Bacteroidota bacterium]
SINIFMKRDTIILLFVAIVFWGCEKTPGEKEKPNIVIVFTDDQGYADVGVYGAQGFATPHIDQMANTGMKFTDFYVASSVCSPSRAALLTGCYPQRIGIPQVLFPERENTVWDPTDRKSKTGIHSDETTLAEMLKAQGYATACFGKWHLGHHKPFMPLQQGFDEYFGLPYSNDMRPGKKPGKTPYPKLPLIQDNQVFRYMEDDQSTLTTEYTEQALDFIQRNRDTPFFMYVAHSMPHIPLYVTDKFKGHSQKGIYGDVIEEIDWSVGQINKTLKELGLEENTLVIFTCDNGPWLIFGDHGGSAYPLREGKFTTFEGGQRVPCVMKWPAQIPPGRQCNEIASTLDFLPTMAHITGAQLPKKKIDGHNIIDLMTENPNAKSPTDAFFYYRGWHLEAVRSGKWKLHLPHTYKQVVPSDEGNVHGRKGIPSEIGLSLFDLSVDIGEKNNLAQENPEVVEILMTKIDAMKEDLGDDEFSGTGKRPCGFITEKAD